MSLSAADQVSASSTLTGVLSPPFPLACAQLPGCHLHSLLTETIHQPACSDSSKNTPSTNFPSSAFPQTMKPH